jgi:hypothetical protein
MPHVCERIPGVCSRKERGYTGGRRWLASIKAKCGKMAGAMLLVVTVQQHKKLLANIIGRPTVTESDP